MNVGYEGFSNMQLLAFNGERVKSLKHLVRLADESTEEFLRFDLFRDRLVVLEAAGVAEATTQICEDNSIPSPRSADLVDATAAVVDDVQEPPPALAGVQLERPGETEAAAEAESEGGDLGQGQQPQQQQQPTTGVVNGGTPRQPPAIAGGAAVPARGKREPQQQQQQSGRGSAAAAAGERRAAEPRRAKWRSAAVTALRRIGAGAPTKGGLRIEEGARLCRGWMRGARRGSNRDGVGGVERDRRARRGRWKRGD